jgi:hypothetical protein
MYYEGMSENEIRRNLIQQDKNYISSASVYNWVRCFTDLAVKQTNDYVPQVSGVWVADETVIGFLSIMLVIDNNSMPLWIRQAHHERFRLSFFPRRYGSTREKRHCLL